MAKIVLKPALDFAWPSQVYLNAMAATQHGTKSATYVETSDDGDKIIFSGTGFTYDMSNHFTGGTVTEIEFRNASGQAYAIFTDVSFKASNLPAFVASGSHVDFFDFLSAGKDKVIGNDDQNYLQGGGGNDVLLGKDGDDLFNGGTGNDHMTGGRGHDQYSFFGNDGFDVITDFHGAGAEAQQDQITCFIVDFTLRKAGHDVIVDFDGTDSTVRLLDVKLSQVQDNITHVI